MELIFGNTVRASGTGALARIARGLPARSRVSGHVVVGRAAREGRSYTPPPSVGASGVPHPVQGDVPAPGFACQPGSNLPDGCRPVGTVRTALAGAGAATLNVAVTPRIPVRVYKLVITVSNGNAGLVDITGLDFDNCNWVNGGIMTAEQFSQDSTMCEMFRGRIIWPSTPALIDFTNNNAAAVQVVATFFGTAWCPPGSEG
jgi:hypothetical protein